MPLVIKYYLFLLMIKKNMKKDDKIDVKVNNEINMREAELDQARIS